MGVAHALAAALGPAGAAGAPALTNVAVCLAFLLLGLLVCWEWMSALTASGRGAACGSRPRAPPPTAAPPPQLPRPKFLERSATAAAFVSPAGLLFRVRGEGGRWRRAR